MPRALDTSHPLGRLLVEREVSQWAVAKALDIPPDTLSAYARGKRRPARDRAIVIANYFGVRVSDLFPEEHYDGLTDPSPGTTAARAVTARPVTPAVG